MKILDGLKFILRINKRFVIWNGLSNIKPTFMKIAKAHKVFSNGVSLDQILPNEDCISIGKVTELFVLCFIALQTQYIDIKQVAHYLSRYNGRMKTTLCKLYQITHIFEAMDILTKTDTISEFKLNDKYFITPQIEKSGIESLLSIESLLNRKTDTVQPTLFFSRRFEFQNDILLGCNIPIMAY